MKNRGFTLLEITIVVAIITLLSTIFLANYREGERVFALQRSIHKLAQDLRRAEEMAISAQKFKELDGTFTFPQGGYGIYFATGTNSYILFADCDGEKQYNTSGSALSCANATSGNYYPYEKIEEFSLESRIKIFNFSPSLNDALTITFFPPDPTVTFIPSATVASITLTINGQTKSVKIYKTGLIDLD